MSWSSVQFEHLDLSAKDKMADPLLASSTVSTQNQFDHSAMLYSLLVFFSEVKIVLVLWERGPKRRPLLRGCPFLGGSEVHCDHVACALCTITP